MASPASPASVASSAQSVSSVLSDSSVPSAQECSAYMLVLKHLEKKFCLSGYCLDLIGALLKLFKRDLWRVVQVEGQVFQIRKFTDEFKLYFFKTAWTISGWKVAWAPAGSELVSGEVLSEEVGNSEEPFTRIKNHLSIKLFPTEYDSDQESLPSREEIDSASCLVSDQVLFQGLEELTEDCGEEERISLDEEIDPEEIEVSVRNLDELFHSVAD